MLSYIVRRFCIHPIAGCALGCGLCDHPASTGITLKPPSTRYACRAVVDDARIFAIRPSMGWMYRSMYSIYVGFGFLTVTLVSLSIGTNLLLLF